MINMHDIMDMTDLTEDEIAAIAEHEGLPISTRPHWRTT